MTWWGWPVEAVYVLGYVVTFRYTAYAMAHEFGEPDKSDVAFALIFSVLFCVVWPVVLFIQLGLAERFLMAEPPRQRRERELKEREGHIRELEREAGIC